MRASVRWFIRPDCYEPNHAVPRYGWRVQHAHTATNQLVYACLQKHQATLGRNLGFVVKSMSLRAIAAETGLALSTIRDNLRDLIRKHSIIPWDVSAAQPGPRRRGDHGGVTVWRLPEYRDVLKARAEDPNVGTVRGRNFYVIGPGRRLLTPAELELWQLDVDKTENLGLRAAVLDATEDDVGVTESEPVPYQAHAPPSPPTAMVPPTASPPVDPLPGVILRALKANTRQHFARKDAERFVARLRERAAKRGESLTDEEICVFIGLVRRAAKGGVVEKIVYYLDGSVIARLDSFFDERADRAAAAAADLASIAEAIAGLTPEEREYLEREKGVKVG